MNTVCGGNTKGGIKLLRTNLYCFQNKFQWPLHVCVKNKTSVMLHLFMMQVEVDSFNQVLLKRRAVVEGTPLWLPFHCFIIWDTTPTQICPCGSQYVQVVPVPMCGICLPSFQMSALSLRLECSQTLGTCSKTPWWCPFNLSR